MLSSAMTVVTARRLSLLAAGMAGVLVFVAGRGVGQQPRPKFPALPTPSTPALAPLHPDGLPAAGKAQDEKGAKPDDKKDNCDKENGLKDKPKDTSPELTLGECIAIALEKQPALKAVLASQAASQAGVQGLNGIGRIGSLVSPDLPVRKEQAGKGLVAAAADVQKVHNEIVQDATRMYYTIVYARQQEGLAEDVVAQLDLLVELAKKILNSKDPGEMTKAKLDLMEIGLGKARGLLLTARVGQKQAAAALREIMGVEPSFAFQPKDKEMTVMSQKVPLTRELIVDMALAQRPELALAAAGVDAFRLEVYAQSKLPFRRTVPTLASGADIHAKDLPTAMRGKEYRPGAIVPEMPPQLVGTKFDRVCRAMAYSQRADSVYEKTRGLITLEAENAFYEYELASGRLMFAKCQFDSGKDLMDRVRENIDNLKASKEQLVQSYVIAAQAQSDYFEAVYQHLLALAALERVTAGGIRPAFPGR